MEDFIPIAGILMVTILGGIPLIGLTIRFAIKPAVESIAQALGESQSNRLAPEIKSRLDHIEGQMVQMQATLGSLSGYECVRPPALGRVRAGCSGLARIVQNFFEELRQVVPDR